MKIRNGLPYFEIPKLASIAWLKHAFLTRRGGLSPAPFDSLNLSGDNGDGSEAVSRNRDLIADAFSFDPSRLVLLGQIHDEQILVLEEPLSPMSSFTGYDAAITNTPDTFLGILTADCLPVFVVDLEKRVIGAVHAGRQGTSLHIVPKVLKRMQEVFDCSLKDLYIGFGPSIGPCCYEVDEKVFLREWEPFAKLNEKGRWWVDLAGINISQMKDEGVREDQVLGVNICTRCNQDLFFSYRRDGRTGRQLSFIGIT